MDSGGVSILVVCTCLAEFPELLELVLTAAVDDLDKHLWEEHGTALPQHAHPRKMLSLEVAHHVAKVDVEELPVRPQHNVVVVAVSDAKDEHGDCVASAREHKVVQSLLQLRFLWVLTPQPVVDNIPLECGSCFSNPSERSSMKLGRPLLAEKSDLAISPVAFLLAS